MIFLLTLYPLENNLQVGWSYIWPLGCVEQLGYDTGRAIRVINRSNRIFKLLPSSLDTDASSHIIQQDSGLVCILHIGESLNASHLTINGYERDTTPWLSNKKELINFPDCVASADLTDRAILTILTNGRRNFQEVKDPLYMPSSPGIMDFFHTCNFRCASFWHHEVLEADNFQFLAQQVKYFVRSTKDNFGYKTDIIEQIDQIRNFIQQQGNQNCFLLVNNYGSHAFFTNYDKLNPPFPIKLSPSPMSSPQQNPDIAKNYINAYDCTVHYTDRFFQAVAEQLKGRPFIYVYVGDHGEYLGEDGLWLRGNVASEEFYKHSACKVPFLIFYSPEFERLHPHFTKALQVLRTKQSMSTAHEHVFHTLLGIMGINTKYYEPSLDLSNPAALPYYGPHPRRCGESVEN